LITAEICRKLGNSEMKKALRGYTNIARWLAGGAGRPKFNQLEMVVTFSYRPSLVRISLSLSLRSNGYFPGELGQLVFTEA